MGALLGQWGLGLVLGFLWPQKLGAFGGVVRAAEVDELEVGEVKMVREGRFYLVRVPEGFLALWWKCPHLGCTVPWLPEQPLASKEALPDTAALQDDSFAERGRFQCPCHQSLYNRYGEIVKGPATRPMDHFPVEVRGGSVYVATSPTGVLRRTIALPSDATPV